MLQVPGVSRALLGIISVILNWLLLFGKDPVFESRCLIHTKRDMNRGKTNEDAITEGKERFQWGYDGDWLSSIKLSFKPSLTLFSRVSPINPPPRRLALVSFPTSTMPYSRLASCLLRACYSISVGGSRPLGNGQYKTSSVAVKVEDAENEILQILHLRLNTLDLD